MANIKIAQLTNQTTLSDTDTVIVETATSTNKMTVGALKPALNIPYGGVLESGQDGMGSWTKYADGTLVCSTFIKFQYLRGDTIRAVWNFPHPFTKITGVSGTLSQVNDLGVADFIISGVITSPMLIFATSATSITIEFIGNSFIPTDYIWGSLTVIGRWK